VGGSSAIESTTQPGARWRISAASARARGWTISAGAIAP
jgi:hypothetical protein